MGSQTTEPTSGDAFQGTEKGLNPVAERLARTTMTSTSIGIPQGSPPPRAKIGLMQAIGRQIGICGLVYAWFLG